jgi:hypothetical protein
MTTTTHPPLGEAGRHAVVQRHRDDIAHIFAALGATLIGVLSDESSLRRVDLHGVEFVAEFPIVRGLGNILAAEVALDQLLGFDTFIHELSVECEESRIARKDALPL